MGSRPAADLYMTSSSQRPTSVDCEVDMEVYPYRKSLIFLRHPNPDAPRDVDVRFSVHSKGERPTQLRIVVSAGGILF